MQPLLCRNLIVVFILVIIARYNTMSQEKQLNAEIDLMEKMDVPGKARPGLITDIDAHTSGFTNKTLNAYSIKAVRDFKKRYTKVTDEKWIESTDGYLVIFTSDNMTTKVRYTSSGKWINSVKRYKEINLDEEIKAIVKPVFYNDSIIVIYEVSAADSKHIVYYIHLKQVDRYKIIKVVDGEMQQVQSFTIQHPK